MRLASDQPSILRLQDNLSGSTLEIHYRPPTAKEHAAYANGMTKRKGRQIVNCTGECRQKFGKAILKGFRDGDFGEEKGGKVTLVSSNPDSKDFREDWKEWFCKHNPDLVERLAIVVFEMPAQLETPDDPDGDLEEDGDDTDPN